MAGEASSHLLLISTIWARTLGRYELRGGLQRAQKLHKTLRTMLARRHTFPFIFVQLRTFICHRRGRAKARQRGGATRGFTLIEMMVVVVIITLVASIAMPGIGRRMRSSKTRQAADTIGQIYSNARVRAMGRGSAVLVRFDSGVFTIQEATLGSDAPDAGCASLPEPYCLPRGGVDPWVTANGKSQILKTYDFASSGDYDIGHYTGGAQTFDVCFSPAGRAYSRGDFAAPLTNMTAPTRFWVQAPGEGDLRRNVTLSTSGATRTVAVIE